MLRLKPVLVIGLGGSGKLGCKILKKYFKERYEKDLLDPVTGLPPLVDILCIETDPGKEKEEKQLTLPDVDTIEAFINKKDFDVIQSDDYLNRNPEIKDWLAKPLPIGEIEGGAGQIRQAGRLAFWIHRKAREKIEKRISGKLTDLLSDHTIGEATRRNIQLISRTIDVYIITSICGGTGAGMLLDIAGLIRKYSRSSKIFLIGLLPGIFEQEIDISQSIQRLYANAYATLKEINYFMRKNPWRVTYTLDERRRHENVDIAGTNLFDYLFLVSEKSPNLHLVDRLHLSPLIADFLYYNINFVGERLRSSRINFDQYITPDHYCSSLGVAVLSFPLEEVLSICSNTLGSEVTSLLNSGEYTSEDLNKRIKDLNTGLINTIFDFSHWQDKLCEAKEYKTIRPESILSKKREATYSNLENERKRIEEFLKEDREKISQRYKDVLDEVVNSLDEEVKDSLVTKGPEYAKQLVSKLHTELKVKERVHEEEQERQTSRVEELSEKIKNEFRNVKNLLKKWWWRKKCLPNLRRILLEIREQTDTMLKLDKTKFALRILDEMIREGGQIRKKMGLIEDLQSKLTNIGEIFERKKEKESHNIAFAASAERKIISTDAELTKFYDARFNKEATNIEKALRKRLSKWLDKIPTGIRKEILNEINKRVDEKELRKLTLEDVVAPDKINEYIEEGFRRSEPFWQHEPQDTLTYSFLISGYQGDNLQQRYSAVKNVKEIITDENEPKRRLIFLRVEAGVPLSALYSYELKNYAEDYKELAPECKWIHFHPIAFGFEDPIGISIGMEEEDLLYTCEDLGIVFRRGIHFKCRKIARERGKEKEREEEIGAGLENTIRALQNDSALTKNLIRKVMEKLKKMSQKELMDYLNAHNLRFYHDDREEFSGGHSEKYKGVPSHWLPSYIVSDIKKERGIS